MNRSKVKNTVKIPVFGNFKELRDFLMIDHKIRSRFKSILLLSNGLNKNEIINEFSSEFKIKKKENLILISKRDDKTNSILFMGYIWFIPSKPFFMIFTFAPSKAVQKYLIRPFLNKNSELNQLWITHQLVLDLIDYFIEKYDVVINQFEGYYTPSSNKKSLRRPEINRKIRYQGNDALTSYYELQELYGINIEGFGGLVESDQFIFKRKDAIISFSKGDLTSYVEISEWLFEQAIKYIKEISKFKKNLYESVFRNRRYNLSNVINFKFKNVLSSEILDELIKEIHLSDNFDVLCSYEIKTTKFIAYDLEIANRNKIGAFQLLITPYSAKISQLINTNFIGVFPILDLIDFTQPNNIITVEAS